MVAADDTSTPPVSDLSRLRIQRAGLTASSAFLLVGAVVTAYVLRDVFVAAHRTVGWVVACAVVALLVDPLVERVEGVMPRWLAVITVLLGLVATVGLLTAGLALDLGDSIEELKQSAPSAAAELSERYTWLADIDAAERVQAFVDELDQRVRRDAVSAAAATVPTYLVTGILMLFLLAYGKRYFEGFANQFSPPRRLTIRTVGRQAALRGRRYLLVALAHSVVNGVVVSLVCRLLDLPAEIALGFAVGALTIIPLIGVLVGGIPAALLAFGLEGWETGAVVVVTLVALQLLEIFVVRPAVDPRTVRVGPAIAVIVGLLGFELYGIGGATYGVALAVLAMAASDTIGGLTGDDQPA